MHQLKTMKKAIQIENLTNVQGNTDWNLHKWTRQHQLKTQQVNKATSTENPTNEQWQHQLKTPQINEGTPT